MKILIVEDDKDIADVVATCVRVQWPGSECIHLSRGSAVPPTLVDEQPDLMVLDLALPDIDGLDLLRKVRDFSSVPVVVLTARTDEAELVKGLMGGADDYITKPFSHLELMARMHAVLRRARRSSAPPTAALQGIEVNTDRRSVSVGGKDVRLTPSEWRLLDYLIRKHGAIATYESIALEVWGTEFVEKSTIKACVSRLRSKLSAPDQEHSPIVAHRGFGYSLGEPVLSP